MNCVYIPDTIHTILMKHNCHAYQCHLIPYLGPKLCENCWEIEGNGTIYVYT